MVFIMPATDDVSKKASQKQNPPYDIKLRLELGRAEAYKDFIAYLKVYAQGEDSYLEYANRAANREGTELSEAQKHAGALDVLNNLLSDYTTRYNKGNVDVLIKEFKLTQEELEGMHELALKAFSETVAFNPEVAAGIKENFNLPDNKTQYLELRGMELRRMFDPGPDPGYPNTV